MIRKRFTDVSKWEDVWFAALSTEGKLLWVYLCDKCDEIGVYKVNKRLAEFDLWEGCLDNPEEFSGKINVLDDSHWFIIKFCKFQYGSLNENNNFHKSLLAKIYKLDEFLLSRDKNHVMMLNQVMAKIPPRNFISGDKVKEKEKVKEKVKEVKEGVRGRDLTEALDHKYSSEFEEFWKLYVRKVGKDVAYMEWKKSKLNNVKDEVIESVIAYNNSNQVKKGFIMNPDKWIRDGHWKDEHPVSAAELSYQRVRADHERAKAIIEKQR